MGLTTVERHGIFGLTSECATEVPYLDDRDSRRSVPSDAEECLKVALRKSLKCSTLTVHEEWWCFVRIVRNRGDVRVGERRKCVEERRSQCAQRGEQRLAF